ncbi:response regulator transcription factor [Dyadobacter sp. 676]|uniref:Response regulator transcription factor n=1 Tax=Dyadobacter sp. 676 TaxID=3088362 RepID=A0AAU8FN04_9BACT
MRKINCLVVDDEPIARDILKSHIGQLPGLHLQAMCKNAAEAYKALNGFPVDVLFLDIRMPVVTGTTFLRSLQKPPLVIFTTAYSEYAVEGFDLNAVDYLLKPVTFERFCQAVQKVRERIAGNDWPAARYEPASYLFIRQDTRLVKVDFDDICYIRGERDFCSIYLTNGKRMLAGSHLKLLNHALAPGQFMRVHRSYIVNLGKLRAIKGNMIEMCGTEIPIGSSFREELLRLLKI